MVLLLGFLFLGRNFLKKVSPKPSSKTFEEGVCITEFVTSLHHSERIAGFVSFSNSFAQ